MSNETDLGYFKRAVEELTAQTALLHQIVKEHMRKEEEDRKELMQTIEKLQDRVKVVENEILVNKAILSTLKWIGGAVVGILMVNLGDVSGLFHLFR